MWCHGKKLRSCLALKKEEEVKEQKLEKGKKSANLILITFDQWRGDWLDTKKRKVKLQNISELNEESWVNKRCYTSSPQCVPARLSWITGLAPSELNVTQNQSVNLPGHAPSLIRDLRGFRT